VFADASAGVSSPGREATVRAIAASEASGVAGAAGSGRCSDGLSVDTRSSLSELRHGAEPPAAHDGRGARALRGTFAGDEEASSLRPPVRGWGLERGSVPVR
jgi:hypothetical protein